MSSSSIPFMPTPVVIVTTIGATLSVGGAYVTIAFVVFVLRAFFPPDRDGPCSGKEVLQIIENTIKSRSTILWKAYNYLFPRLATQPEGTTMNHPAATAVEDLSVIGDSHIRGAKGGAAAAKPEDKSEIRNKHFFTRKISSKTKNWAALSCIAIFLLLSITLDFRGCSMTSYSIEEKGNPTFLWFFPCKTVGSPEVVATGPIKELSSKVTPSLADANVGIIMNVLEEKRTLNDKGIVVAEPIVDVVEPKTKGTSTISGYILSSTIEPGTEELIGVHDVITAPPDGEKSELATVEEGRGVIREVDGEMVKQNLIGNTARLLKQHKRNLEEGKDNNVFSPTSEEADYYYIDWTELKCVNDPAKRPSYIVEVGTDLFETAQECCQKTWLSQIPNNCVGSQLLFSNEQSVLTQSSNAVAPAHTALPTLEPSDCICDFVSTSGYIHKPNTNCKEYVSCVDGHIDEEYSCDTVGTIFDFEVQSCNWQASPFVASCQLNSTIDSDVYEDCHCEFVKTDCEKSIQCLSSNPIPTWKKPLECTRADDVCSAGEAGETLYQEHYQEVSSAVENECLTNIYNELGGQNWFDNTGWVSGLDYCKSNTTPFGLTCSNGLISDIDLSNNNLVGVIDSSRFFSKIYNLKSLKLANNTLKGSIDFNSFYQLQILEHVDMSRNFLEGEVDVLLSPAIKHVDMGHNNFTKVMTFTNFRWSHQTLEVVVLCFNNIRQDISKLLQAVRTNLKELVLTGNHISGSLPDPLPTLDNMERFILNNNAMIGTIPEITRSFSRLKQLDLSNQKQSSKTGLSGLIPTSWANLPYLDTLDLSNNRLTGIIPPGIGNLPQLKILNLSSNELGGGIPADIGNAAGICDVIDMSYNNISGKIPSELGMFKDSSKNTHILLGWNEHIDDPAPLDLCNVSGFDLHNDNKWCPHERKILKELYVSTKGGEWTESTHWTDPHIPHCDWDKVECNDDDAVTELNLKNNGLSGKLTASISELSSLKVLDLRDNDIKDIIPATIGDLENLTNLRLSFNSFRGNVPPEFHKLHHLVEVHLHGNRLEGDMPLFTFHKSETNTLIADCGYPTDFDKPIFCPDCTMCCNSDGDCHEAQKTPLEEVDHWGFYNYVQFLWILLFLLIGYTFTMVYASILYDPYRDNKEVQAADQIEKSDEEDQAGEQDQADEKRESAHAGFSISPSTLNSQQGGVADQAGPAMQTAQAGSITRSSVLNSQLGGGAHPASQTIHTGSVTSSSALEEDWKYALDSFGRDSVYSYILSESKFARLISVAVVAFQTWALITFVLAAPKDFENEDSDWVYSWKCPRNNLECTDETDLARWGWIMFTIIMFAHVLKDLVNGLKLLLLCGKHKHDVLSRIKYYLGGFVLSGVSALAIYASTVYNTAIARSNTDIVMNAVIIIFIVDVDEYLHGGIQAVQSLMGTQGFIEDENDAKITKLSATIETLSRKLEKNDEEIKKILRLNNQLMSRVDLLENNGKG